MSFLDMRTVVFGNFISDLVCLLVMILLWRQNRGRFAGMALWVFDFALQTLAFLLIILRGSVPDWISLVLANTMVIGGGLLGLMALERFAGKTGSRLHNYVILGAFVLVHSYFTFIQPDLAVRTLNVSVGLAIMCSQCAWLALHRAAPGMRRLMTGTGVVFAIYTVASLVRVAEFFTASHTTADFFQSGVYDAIAIIVYQVLFILLTFAITLMVNQRLLAEVRTQEEKFSKAFHSSPYAVIIARLTDGGILEVNEGFLEMTGYSHDHVAGKSVLGLHFWANEEDRAKIVRELSAGHQVNHMELQFRRRSGELMTGVLSADVITIDGERCVLSSISDITELKKIQKELELEAGELQRSNEDLERFAHVASHDLREPLRSISSYLQLLQRKYAGSLADESWRYVNLSMDAADRLQSMIDEVLEYSQVEKQGEPLKPLDFESVLRSAAANLEVAIRETGASVTHDPLPIARADRGQMVRLLQNLLANSIKYRSEKPPRVHVSAVKTGSEWVFSVRDNGAGIDAEHRAHIFDMFYRAPAGGVTGAGLGLSVAKRIIERHGGRMWVESEPGTGTTMYFTIPDEGGTQK